MEIEQIEFKDFKKSITTEEFIGILELVKGVNDNFEAALESRRKRGQESLDHMDKVVKEHGEYSQAAIDARRLHKGLDEVTSKDIKKGFSTFLVNYDGIIEFLTRFELVGKVKKHDITEFLNKKEK